MYIGLAMTSHDSDPTVQASVLIVDDDAAVCWALENVLKQHHYQTFIAADAAAARRLLKRQRPDLVITDVRMPGESGLDLLSSLRADHPQIPVVVSTAYGTMDTAVEAVRRGAFDYLAKPLDLDRTLALVRRALGEDALAAAAKPNSEGKNLDGDLVGSTPAMQDIYRRIAAAAATDVGVLMRGDAGTGKELAARALHRYSKRRDGPFIAVNCGALSETIIESELFGHEAGAFTEARTRKIGRIEAAHGGTLFLDEVGELPVLVQMKLLRFLEEQKITRIGGEQDTDVDVRVIAATNRELGKLIIAGTFREDLSYRLGVVTMTLPRLIDRLDDLPALVRHFLARSAQRLGRPIALTDEAMETLRRHQWPGNIRELKHVLEEAAVLATGGIIGSSHLSLPTSVADAPSYSSYHAAAAGLVARLINQHSGAVYQKYYDAVEEPLLREVLARTEGNQLRAAELLGINRITLKKRMDELGINRG
jgi:nitrogen regulation protein NR(I)